MIKNFLDQRPNIVLQQYTKMRAIAVLLLLSAPFALAIAGSVSSNTHLDSGQHGRDVSWLGTRAHFYRAASALVVLHNASVGGLKLIYNQRVSTQAIMWTHLEHVWLAACRICRCGSMKQQVAADRTLARQFASTTHAGVHIQLYQLMLHVSRDHCKCLLWPVLSAVAQWLALAPTNALDCIKSLQSC
jgi:hypothetical protein